MRRFLTGTVIGPYSKTLYGKAGQEVELISEHGNMCIVRIGLVRFPVSTVLLSNEVPSVQECDATTALPPPQTPPARKLKKTKIITSSPKLF